jgi:hypothetical protein
MMSWWRPARPCTDNEITAYVAAEVVAGRIKTELAPMVERALRDEAAGKCVVMRDPKIVRRFPKPR